MCSGKGTDNVQSQNSTSCNISKITWESMTARVFWKIFWRGILCIQRQEITLITKDQESGLWLQGWSKSIHCSKHYLFQLSFSTYISLNDNPTIYLSTVIHLSCHSVTRFLSLSTKYKSICLGHYLMKG